MYQITVQKTFSSSNKFYKALFLVNQLPMFRHQSTTDGTSLLSYELLLTVLIKLLMSSSACGCCLFRILRMQLVREMFNNSIERRDSQITS